MCRYVRPLVQYGFLEYEIGIQRGILQKQHPSSVLLALFHKSIVNLLRCFVFIVKPDLGFGFSRCTSCYSVGIIIRFKYINVGCLFPPPPRISLSVGNPSKLVLKTH